jgi:hypothetical protein
MQFGYENGDINHRSFLKSWICTTPCMPARQPGNDIDKLPRWHTGSQAAPTFLALSTHLLYPLVQQKLN